MTSKIKKVDFEGGFGQAVADSQRGWEYDRALTVGASEVFTCIRKNVYRKRFPDQATIPDEVEWGHTERGNLIENEFAVPCMRKMFGDDNCLFMGEEQKTFVLGKLSATPDGLVVGVERDALEKYGVEDLGDDSNMSVEIKTFGNQYAAPKELKYTDPNDSAKTKTKYLPKPKHEGQTVVQMGILRRTTNHQPEIGMVLYFNPVNLKDIRPAVVRYNEDMFKYAQKRADDVFDESKGLSDYPAEGKIKGEDCQYCEFAEACHKLEMDAFPDRVAPKDEISDSDRQELGALTKRVKECRDKIKEVERDKKAAEAELKDKLFGLDTNKVVGSWGYASMSKRDGKMSLNKQAMIDDGIDPDKYLRRGNSFYVTLVKYDGT